MTSDNDKLAKNVKPVVSCYQDECFKASSGVFLYLHCPCLSTWHVTPSTNLPIIRDQDGLQNAH